MFRNKEIEGYKSDRLLIGQLVEVKRHFYGETNIAVISGYHEDENAYSIIALNKQGVPVNRMSWFYITELKPIESEIEYGLKIIRYYHDQICIKREIFQLKISLLGMKVNSSLTFIHSYPKGFAKDEDVQRLINELNNEGYEFKLDIDKSGYDVVRLK